MYPVQLSKKAVALSICLLAACAPLRPKLGASARPVVTVDNQEEIWTAGKAYYDKGRYLEAADLFQMAYQLKPVDWICQNIGMAYLRSAQVPEYLELLRLAYVRRSLPSLHCYRSWLINVYGRTRPIAALLANTNQKIADAEHLERELRLLTEPQRKTASLR